MHTDVESVLFDAQKIEAIVSRLAAEIYEDYQGKNPLIIGVLKGSFIFMADLVRHLNMPCELDFMAVSSYGNGTTSLGRVKIIKDLDTTVEGRHVIVVEDILDSGNTLSYLMGLLRTRRPASLKLCVLLDKPERRNPRIAAELGIDYRGVTVPNEFLVGYGLDYAETYRNLPDICILKPEIYAPEAKPAEILDI